MIKLTGLMQRVVVTEMTEISVGFEGLETTGWLVVEMQLRMVSEHAFFLNRQLFKCNQSLQ